AFCSEDCESAANQQYHQYLCTNSKVNTNADESKETTFVKYVQDQNSKYPQMIAQLFTAMVAEELDKKNRPKYNSWDHIERLKGAELTPTDKHANETKMIKELLSSKVPGIDEFLTDEVYLMLLGKMNENAFDVISATEVSVEKSTEPSRKLDSDNILGSSVYKISSYLCKSPLDDANVKISFNGNKITVTALKPIKKDEQIKAYYN
ncbi:hypothetical protein CU097_007496, partial [Rhizopus azygosporus]